jgi:predicted acetyltransferase
MSDLLFIEPSEEHEAMVWAYREESLAADEVPIHGAPMLAELDTYSDWLKVARCDFSEKTGTAGWVDATTLLAVREADGKLVGIVNVRHELTDFLRETGAGHIGYSVRADERRKGYATQLCRKALDVARGLGLDAVMLGCSKCNIASQKTIITCGGVLEREVKDSPLTPGCSSVVYWINLSGGNGEIRA